MKTIFQEIKKEEKHCTEIWILKQRWGYGKIGRRYGLNCQKGMKVGDLMTKKAATKAPVNSGYNYNSRKVAKFIVGPTCTKGVMVSLILSFLETIFFKSKNDPYLEFEFFRIVRHNKIQSI